MIGDSNDEAHFPHKLLLTDAQVSRLRKAFANNSSANTKLSKTQISKMIQSGGFVLIRIEVVIFLNKEITKNKDHIKSGKHIPKFPFDTR